MRRKLALAAATWLALAATAAHAQRACLTTPEAEALVGTIAPDLVRLTATLCAPSLPAGALLRRAPDRLAAKYATTGDWPLARQALKKMVTGEMGSMLDSDFARPLVGSLVAPIITKDLKPADCPAIDRTLTLVDPLPARSIVAVVVQIATLAQQAGSTGPLRICPAGRQR